MIYAVILAGGIGKRMGNTDMPKQFLMLDNKPIIIHTIEQFLLNKNIDKIVVCCPQQWVSYMNDLKNKYLGEGNNIFITEGGINRNETIINGCHFIKNEFGMNKDDYIIAHDAVRPFVTQRIIDDNIIAVKEYNAVDTVINAVDTIVKTDDKEYVKEIPKRDNMFLGQTPQSFNIKILMDLYDKIPANEKNKITDICTLFTLNDFKVKMVYGEDFNSKITTLFDLKIFDSIIMERGNK